MGGKPHFGMFPVLQIVQHWHFDFDASTANFTLLKVVFFLKVFLTTHDDQQF